MKNPVQELFVGRPVVFQPRLFYSKEDVSVLGLASQWINDAVVTASLFDSDDAAVIDSLSVPYVTGSDGYYRGIAHPDPVLVKDAVYTWKITVVKDGLSNLFEGNLRAMLDPGTDRP